MYKNVPHWSHCVSLTMHFKIKKTNNKMSNMFLLQVFPGNVRVAGGSSPRWGSAKSQNISSQSCQSLGAKFSVNEIQMCSHNHHRRVWCSCLWIRKKSECVINQFKSTVTYSSCNYTPVSRNMKLPPPPLFASQEMEVITIPAHDTTLAFFGGWEDGTWRRFH